MPLVDMPLESLFEYQGTNPCPPDFDEYWDKAIAQMNAVEPNVELIPAEFQAPNAECFDLYFTGLGGARIHAKYLRPKNNKTPHPAVLMFHGYSCSSGEWNSKLNYVNMGFSVAALDTRGQGGKSEDNLAVKGNTLHGHIIRGLDDSPENLLFKYCFLDTAQLAKIVMSFDEVDENRVGALGGSQGGALTLACAALEPKIKRIVAQFPFLCDYQRIWNIDLVNTAYLELKDYFRHFDPQHKNEQEVFTRLGYIDLQYIVKRIKADVLWAVGLMDVTCPPSSQFAAYNKITAKKEIRVFPDFGHEDLPGFWDEAFVFMSKL